MKKMIMMMYCQSQNCSFWKSHDHNPSKENAISNILFLHHGTWPEINFWPHLHFWLIFLMQKMHNHDISRNEHWRIWPQLREKSKNKFHVVITHAQNRVCVNDPLKGFQMHFIFPWYAFTAPVDIYENYSSKLKKRRPFVYTQTLKQ